MRTEARGLTEAPGRRMEGEERGDLGISEQTENMEPVGG
jgi:hypothetical protein